MKIKTETFRCYLKILSPVHIGCDEVYEPTSFVVDETGTNGPEMVVFDPLTFIAGLDAIDRMKFSEICKKGTVSSIIELYKFLSGKKADGKRVKLSPHFVDHYRTVLKLSGNEKNLTQNLNNFQIKRTSFRLYDERPYIPGSALKGSIRTAYLNSEARTKKVSSPKSIELQANLMNYDSRRIETDPFRLVKVSDFMPVGDVKTKIVYSINRKKKSDKEPESLHQILEVIEPGGIFIGEISVEHPLTKRYINSPATLEKIISAPKFFYSKENTRELSELSRIGIKGIDISNQDNSIPVRLGRHSGAESITVEGYRKIKIRLGKKDSTILDHATTFWLSSDHNKPTSNAGLKPFGWASLTPLTPEMEKKFDADEVVYRSAFDMNVLEKIDVKAAETINTSPAVPVKSPEEKAREQAAEKCATFKLMVNASKNISGDIQRLKPMIDNELDPGAKTEMCQILFEKAMAGDKKKFRKSLKEGKTWAVTIINLCKENQVDTGAFE